MSLKEEIKATVSKQYNKVIKMSNVWSAKEVAHFKSLDGKNEFLVEILKSLVILREKLTEAVALEISQKDKIELINYISDRISTLEAYEEGTVAQIKKLEKLKKE